MEPEESILSDDGKVMVTMVNETLISVQEVVPASPTARYHIKFEGDPHTIVYTPGDYRRVDSWPITLAQSGGRLFVHAYETADRNQEYEHISELIQSAAKVKDVNLDDPSHTYTLWNDIDGHMVYMGSFRDSHSVWTEASKYKGQKDAYVAVGPLSRLRISKVDKGQ